MDTFFSTNNAILRLYNEWTRHPKLLIACDFDDTIYDFHNNNTEHKMVIELLKKCNELGFYVTLFTASKPERYEFMRNHMKELGVKIDAINENVIELKYGNNGKIYYNILLDDRAGLGQAYTVLSSVIEMIKIANEIENKDVSDNTNTPKDQEKPN
jgi:hydroxymethylpyrimidine pyrophosphatase-like HAD family hydrolase